MLVHKVLGKFGKMYFFNELSEEYLKMAYLTNDQVCGGLSPGAYVIRTHFSEEDFVECLQRLAKKKETNRIAIYSLRTQEENKKLIDLLEECDASWEKDDGDLFYIERCVIFCQE